MKFKKGDVVRLKSGGPKMTLDTELGNHAWRCQWFVGTDLKKGDFMPETLEKVSEAEPERQ